MMANEGIYTDTRWVHGLSFQNPSGGALSLSGTYECSVYRKGTSTAVFTFRESDSTIDGSGKSVGNLVLQALPSQHQPYVPAGTYRLHLKRTDSVDNYWAAEGEMQVGNPGDPVTYIRFENATDGSTATSYAVAIAGPKGENGLSGRKNIYDFMTAADIAASKSGTSLTDLSSAFAAAAAWANQTIKPILEFPSGYYLYTVSPNWGLSNLTLIAEGEVRFLNFGSGDAFIIDGGAGPSGIFNFKMLGNFVIRGQTTSGHGIYARSVFDSYIEARIAGCGTGKDCVRIDYAVSTVFKILASINVGFDIAVPSNGIRVSRRTSDNFPTTNCVLRDCVIEGIAGDGIILEYANLCRIEDGTSEGHTSSGRGIVINSGCDGNVISGMDFEQNAGGSASISGLNTRFTNGCNLQATTTVAAAASRTSFSNCRLDILSNAGSFTSLVDTQVGSGYIGAGYTTITGSGTGLSLYNVYDLTIASFIPDKRRNDQYSVVSCPSGATTTIFAAVNTLPDGVYDVFTTVTTGSPVFYGNVATFAVGASVATLRGSVINSVVTNIALTGNDITIAHGNGTTLNVRCWLKERT